MHTVLLADSEDTAVGGLSADKIKCGFAYKDVAGACLSCYHECMKAKQKHSAKSIKFRQSLFWDVDPKTIDPQKHARYIIERILELGNDKEVRWMWGYYPKETMRRVIALPRVQLREKSKAFWSLMFK